MIGYLETHGSEVANMLFTEYNLEDDKQVSFDEGKAEGVNLANDVISELKKGQSVSQVSEKLKVNLDSVQKIKDTLG
jgi:hypothetical protein